VAVSRSPDDADVTPPLQGHPMLDTETLRRHLLSVQQCVTREGLDKLTRLLWRTYDTPAN
jgi:hypothetical protein